MKKLVIKDWMWQKIAREHGAPRVWLGNVDCIFQETEKAYRVLMGSTNHTVIAWVPKSQCEWVETDNQYQETVVRKTYEEAIAHRDFLRSCFC